MESGVQLLAAQKPIKRQNWWKRKFALFWMLAAGGGGGPSVQRPTPPHPTDSPVGMSIYKQREGATCRSSIVSSDSHLELGHQWSGQCHLDCFEYI